MKLTLGIITGLAIAWAIAAIWQPAIRWAFNDQPATPDDWTPRHRTWVNGVEEL